MSNYFREINVTFKGVQSSLLVKQQFHTIGVSLFNIGAENPRSRGSLTLQMDEVKWSGEITGYAN